MTIIFQLSFFEHLIVMLAFKKASHTLDKTVTYYLATYIDKKKKNSDILEIATTKIVKKSPKIFRFCHFCSSYLV
jgi:hypothetical protein